jgi:large subunit ribosomal protein L23
MPKISDLLEKILTTEKTARGQEALNKYTFRVKNGVSQGTVKTEVAKVYKVEVLTVNLMIVAGKKRRLAKTSRFTRLPKWKKAIVTLKEGHKIDAAKVVVAAKAPEDATNDKKL